MQLWERFTARARRAVLMAHDEARRTGAKLISGQHLLVGLLRLPEGAAHDLLSTRVGDLSALLAEAREGLGPAAEPLTEDVSFAPEAQRALTRATEEAKAAQSPNVGTEHVLLGLLREDPPTRELLAARGFTEALARETMAALAAGRTPLAAVEEPAQAAPAPTKSVSAGLSRLHGPAWLFRHDHPPVRNVNDMLAARLTVGQRVADRVTDALGSWPFIICQSLILAAWLGVNTYLALMATLHPDWLKAWDPYPFILLNLVLSFQAAYTGPVVMMSQNRAAARDRLQAQQDYEVNVKAEQELETVLAQLAHQEALLNEVLGRLRGEAPPPAEAAPPEPGV